MKPTVETGQWHNAHGTGPALELVLSQLRTAANRVFQRKATLQTDASGTAQTVWADTEELAQDTHASLTVVVQATSADGTVYGKWEQTALFFRPASGSASMLGAAQDRHTAIVAGGLTVALGISGNKMQLQLNDNGHVVVVDAWVEARIA